MALVACIIWPGQAESGFWRVPACHLWTRVVVNRPPPRLRENTRGLWTCELTFKAGKCTVWTVNLKGFVWPASNPRKCSRTVSIACVSAILPCNIVKLVVVGGGGDGQIPPRSSRIIETAAAAATRHEWVLCCGLENITILTPGSRRRIKMSSVSE